MLREYSNSSWSKSYMNTGNTLDPILISSILGLPCDRSKQDTIRSNQSKSEIYAIYFYSMYMRPHFSSTGTVLHNVG